MAAQQRLRTYLTRSEVAQLLRAAKKCRHGARNHAMILVAYRHGLRACELVQLRWSDVDLERGTIYCRRAKGSRSSVHPLTMDEAKALERLQRTRPEPAKFIRQEPQRWHNCGGHGRRTEVLVDEPILTSSMKPAPLGLALRWGQ